MTDNTKIMMCSVDGASPQFLKTAMTSPLVTIALPCYNAEKTLENTVRSILCQTYEAWELLALDDGSTDRTVEILQGFKDDRINVITDNINKGRCFRLNQAAGLAKGIYYARMDSDDLMFPERLEKQVAFLEAHTDIDLLGSGIVSIDENLNPLGVRYAPQRVDSMFQIFKGEVLYHPTIMGRTEWFRNHPYIKGYVHSDDFASWTKYARDLTIANLQEPLLFYREHGLFTYDKYQGRCRETRKAIAEFGPDTIGWPGTAMLLGRRWLKDVAYSLFQYAGLWNHTLKVVNKPLSATHEVNCRQVLKAIARQQGN